MNLLKRVLLANLRLIAKHADVKHAWIHICKSEHGFDLVNSLHILNNPQSFLWGTCLSIWLSLLYNTCNQDHVEIINNQKSCEKGSN